MVNPQPRHGQQLVGLFRDLSEQEDLLIMIQDTGGNAPAQVLLQATQESAQAISLKLESQASPPQDWSGVSRSPRKRLDRK